MSKDPRMLKALDLPSEVYHFLSLIPASPPFGDQPGAEQPAPESQEVGEAPISADGVLITLEVLLTHLWEILPHASLKFMQREEALIMRLKNAHQGMEATRARQLAHSLYRQRAQGRAEQEGHA